MKVKPNDVSFTSKWKLHVQRKDTMHAIVAYFDIHFTQGDTIVSFSTGMLFPTHPTPPNLFFLSYVSSSLPALQSFCLRAKAG